MNAKLAWIHEKYNHRSETHIGGSSSQAHEIDDVYLTWRRVNQLQLMKKALRETQLSNSICVEPSSSTPNQVRIIPGPAGLVQRAKLLKENVSILGSRCGALMSDTKNICRKLLRMWVSADFNSGAWVSATNYVNAFGGTVTGCLGDIDNFLKNGKLEQVVVIVKSCCSLRMLLEI
ncbi:hypothetical protein Tco_0602977 [Tanacetum coccineum]